MNSLELLQRKLPGEKVDRILFCPAIYEHKAKLIDKSVSEAAQDADLLAEAVFAEYEIYRPDILTVGIDIYNIEAQASGSIVEFPILNSSVPTITDHILSDISEIDKLKVVDVTIAGRMPIITKAVSKVQQKLGNEVLVRGAVSGPFSMAANLVGVEQLLIAQVMQPDEFNKLLDYCASVIVDFGKTFINCGASVCLFDSQASPPFVSPQAFSELILHRLKRIAIEFKNARAKGTELVIGGQTDQIAEFMRSSSFDIVLSDFSASFESFQSHPSECVAPLIRRNISPILIQNGPHEELCQQITETLKLANEFNNVIIGTGVLAYDSTVENVLNIKNMIFADK